MSNSHRAMWSAVIVASLAACAVNQGPRTPPETPTTGNDRATVTGRVVDTSGTAIAGATVTVRASGERTTTDATGAFTLDVPANTLAGGGPNMAPTLLQQFMVSPGATAAVELPLITLDHFKSLVAMGDNPAGGVVAVAMKSISGTGTLAGATVELTPSLGRVMYAPAGAGIGAPDPMLLAIEQDDDAYAWALGVQPHVSIMQLALHGVPAVEPPYALDDVTWPGTFTVDAGALTLVTLLMK